MLLFAATAVQAQIVIGGSVYGGACQANVGGSTFVHIGADDHDVLINAVYGGNDVSGTIGTSEYLPKALTDTITNGIDNTYNTFVRISSEAKRTETTGEGDDAVTTTQLHHIFIGNVFGGSNGSYDYNPKKVDSGESDEDGNPIMVETNPYVGMSAPVINKSYLEIKGGTVAYVYAGGNNATVEQAADICIDNESEVTVNIPDANGVNLLDSKERMESMGIAVLGEEVVLRDEYHFSRVFGGNNLAAMSIRPTWHLNKGKIDNLYSGGNRGKMTSPVGLLLEIDPQGTDEDKKKLVINNVYGGCRMADVTPTNKTTNVPIVNDEEIQLRDADGNKIYNFPAGLSARVLVRGGDINNVYGGNDITGNVKGGNAVGIYTSIRGDVYGGGNGSYPYTDNEKLEHSLEYGDYYYGGFKTEEGYTSSVDALNAFRPNAEQVSIRLWGPSADKPTVIGGSVYVGGNSASLATSTKTNPKVELKIGSHVIADTVYLGNNGANMVTQDILKLMASNVEAEDENGNPIMTQFSSIKLVGSGNQFAEYMDGCAMPLMPSVVFDKTKADGTGDPADYEEYTSQIGSLFCGGNRGSMTAAGKTSINFSHRIIVYNKVVGGCNNAWIPATDYNAEYNGGVIGSAAEQAEGSFMENGKMKDRLELTFSGLKIQPKRWKGNSKQELIWNTVNTDGENVDPVTEDSPFSTPDLNRRFAGGNVYGGCYKSGHVNGNVIINLDSTLVDRKGDKAIFDEIEEKEGEALLYGHSSYTIKKRHSGVILNEQGMDVLGKALNVFGGGYGEDSEIWGSTTINLKAGYTFQIFGGGEMGAIGKGVRDATTKKLTYTTYDAKYSTCINLRGNDNGVYRGHSDDKSDMAEAEFIYGGGFLGPIAGDTQINLGNGRVFNTFAGSCNADILGHTETYVGRQLMNGGTYNDNDGFPWIRDHIYGGNDLGGEIMGVVDFKDYVSGEAQGKVYNDEVTKASAYIEYRQGRVDYIFGGCYGVYNYADSHYKDYTYTAGEADIPDGMAAGMARVGSGFTKPRMESAFVNMRPTKNGNNHVTRVYGAGQGYTQDSDRDVMQNRSYVLIDMENNLPGDTLDVFGAGDYSGVGMGITPAEARANADGVTAATVVDLMRGHVRDVFGASYNEGVTRRTIVNVPEGSTIQADRIFGGAYGVTNALPCDVYEANVNYHSADAWVDGAPKSTHPEDWDKDGYQKAGGVYGGNNSYRRTLFSRVNIDTAVKQKNGWTTRVFGAGYGKNTWAEYTEVNLLNGANVYEPYGGGYGGMVLNEHSAKQVENDSAWSLSLGSLYTAEELAIDRALLMKENALGTTCNSNVHIHYGAYVGNYAYAGGLGASATVCGTTYIGLYGGTVYKDLYAGGTSGAVQDRFKVGLSKFKAATYAYIKGGSVRNVYGGSWEGHIGYHDTSTTSADDDIPGETHVVIGIRPDQTEEKKNAELRKVNSSDAAEADYAYGFYNGNPTIQRNAYGGGEGGAVFGATHLTINNGYIGYVYVPAGKAQDAMGKLVDDATKTTARYEEKLTDETYYENEEFKGTNRLVGCGNAFGGGYDDNSSVDTTNVVLWNGLIRNSVFGGGEIATIGRGEMEESGAVNENRDLKAIHQAGQTNIYMYNGHVLHNVFGGGKGYNELGYGRKNQYYTDGYVFGETRVNIYGGEVGTEEGVKASDGGYGNVFGGGDLGYVYSKGYFSIGTKAKEGTGSPNHIYYYDDAGDLTEDCRVVVSPRLQVRPEQSVTYGDSTYTAYAYVPTEYLNTLKSKKEDEGATKWGQLYTGDKKAADDMVERGVHIYNAVFAGGNVSSNSDRAYANATTVFGNATATLNDVYHQDFITVGTEHTGGLYGGGNLSVCGGYRELNITNYGTDYYGMDQQITLEDYGKLTNRERAYFQLEYLCKQTYEADDKTYTAETSRITEEEYKALDAQYKNETYWVQYGFCSIYAGRLLNTIQRADFCGVYGSRLVLQGALDRVADVGDNTNYTINRVTEVSLNKQKSRIASEIEMNDNPVDEEDYKTPDKAVHGNYFGIYSVVNYLGNLTSDVHFTDKRKVYTYDKETKTEHISFNADSLSFYDFKKNNLTSRERNKGVSENQVALASGVFLELTTEKSTAKKKDYGYITGIVELALINVKQDIEGGGYVYAKNQHGERTYDQNKENVLLSPYNKADDSVGRDEARTYKRYDYSPTSLLPLQTSGNFIHRSKRIIDDCYPNNGVYNDDEKSPAHYWYIKGSVYIYNQEVSAYAGSATAYSKDVKIPLTITAASQGKLQLVNVQPNLYAYYSSSTDLDNDHKIGEEGVKVNNGSETYYLNDVITWWNWNQLSSNEQKYFVKETIVNVDTCTITVGGVPTVYPKGTYVMLPADTAAFKSNFANYHVKDKKGVDVEAYEDMFRLSNGISHDAGYVLTFDMDSPKVWDDYYTHQTSGVKKSKEDYDALYDKSGYMEGPTFKLAEGKTGLFGQREYAADDIIRGDEVADYDEVSTHLTEAEKSTQAEVSRAYVNKKKSSSAISKTAYNALAAEEKENYEEALLCINTIRIGENDYVLSGELVPNTPDTLKALKKRYYDYNKAQAITETEAEDFVNSSLIDAYYCEKGGMYGGQYLTAGTNYSALKSWCALPDGRDHFRYNYDAFDVLGDPDFEGDPEKYDAPEGTKIYSALQPVDYTAIYTGTDELTYTYKGTSKTITKDAVISREEYESLPNLHQYFTRLSLKANQDGYVYIINDDFILAGTPYAKGQDVTAKDYDAITNSSYAAKVTSIAANTLGNSTIERTVFYCHEACEGYSVGDVITDLDIFNNLENKQRNFTIVGVEPTERTTLYVSRESSEKDVTTEKVITVVYQYTYYDDDEDGAGTALSRVNELHVVNIHLKLESGVPEIGPLVAPPTVLPGNPVMLKAPTVTPGLYQPISSGWEIFTNENDANHHRNGETFTNNGTPLYWYQNQNVWVAFFSRTYLGKSYSNPVPLSVANYHDLTEVLEDTENHMFIDRPEVIRNSKIYINDASQGLTQLKQLFDLSMLKTKATSGALKDHNLLNDYVEGCANLDFILRTDLNYTGEGDWTPIASGDGECFSGTLHGDGYTVRGINHSLFRHLCGEVYNLGVTGAFTSAGVADEGPTATAKTAGFEDASYVENCWVKSTAESVNNVKAVYGNPADTERKQVVNSYYPDVNKYAESDARKVTEDAFYNGTVAYNLNGFYLNKRYYDGIHQSSGDSYQYFQAEADGSLPETTSMTTGRYPKTDGDYDAANGSLNYVERRFGAVKDEKGNYDNDFIYAAGSIPESKDVRMRTVTEGTGTDAKLVNRYAPIWPNDYLFFGQSLTFGHTTTTHDELPTHITTANRVYRAPAYFGSSTKGRWAHFNPNAVIAAYEKGASLDDHGRAAYPGMTAIDFQGHGDLPASIGYANGTASAFYPPMLDVGSLQSIVTNGETQNLLVYAPDAGTATYAVLKDYFDVEPVYTETHNQYRTVAAVGSGSVRGHLVTAGLMTLSDHLLVDRQDFNCPIAYRMANGKRMWYQRQPSLFVDTQKGWETVSLPFTAELVTTQQKGEITHFYSGSNTLDNGKTKIGHEYWLREYKGKMGEEDDVFTAEFNYPTAIGSDKTVNNTFLWDYYYHWNAVGESDGGPDANDDKYQTYYEEARTLEHYPLVSKAKPYIIGFPGTTYHEFDLSGDWMAPYTASTAPVQLDRQVITFASVEGDAIGVSDADMDVEAADGYAFKPNYQSREVTGYLMNAVGNAFEQQTGVTTVPFRPYFVKVATGAPAYKVAKKIVFGSSGSSIGIGDRDPSEGETGSLVITPQRGKIVATSTLRQPATVHISTIGGITVRAFTIQPGETIETPVSNAGVYIVNKKKMVVR